MAATAAIAAAAPPPMMATCGVYEVYEVRGQGVGRQCERRGMLGGVRRPGAGRGGATRGGGIGRDFVLGRERES